MTLTAGTKLDDSEVLRSLGEFPDLVNEEASTPFLHGSYCVAGGVLARNTFTSQNGTIPGSFLTL